MTEQPIDLIASLWPELRLDDTAVREWRKAFADYRCDDYRLCEAIRRFFRHTKLQRPMLGHILAAYRDLEQEQAATMAAPKDDTDWKALKAKCESEDDLRATVLGAMEPRDRAEIVAFVKARTGRWGLVAYERDDPRAWTRIERGFAEAAMNETRGAARPQEMSR